MNTTNQNTTITSASSGFEFTTSSVSWISVFAITALLSVVGNSLVIIVFHARFPRKKCDTSLKPYLINLAVSDLIMAVFCMPFTFIDAISSWMFPEFMCSVVLFFQVLSVSASVFTNVAISLNRLRAILFPLRSIYTLRAYSWLLVIIWFCSSGIASVQLFVGQTVVENNSTHCGEVWPSPQAARTYTLCIFVFVYAIPLMLLTGTYTTIGVSLWRNPRRDELLKSKCRVSWGRIHQPFFRTFFVLFSRIFYV